MKSFLIGCSVILAWLMVCLPTYGQNEFKLHAKYKRSDINYLAIKNINQHSHGFDSVLTDFKPVKGEYTVYLFLKEFQGTSITNMDSEEHDTPVVFHDLIILKTNRKNEILDAFFYRLEWAEVPCQFMVFRSFCETLQLVDNLNVSALNFLNEYEIYNGQEVPEFYDTNQYGQRVLKLFETAILRL
jgi:hypothetical protein